MIGWGGYCPLRRQPTKSGGLEVEPTPAAIFYSRIWIWLYTGSVHENDQAFFNSSAATILGGDMGRLVIRTPMAF